MGASSNILNVILIVVIFFVLSNMYADIKSYFYGKNMGPFNKFFNNNISL